MTTPQHAQGSNPSPKLTSELNNLRMVVEARQDRGPEGDKVLGTIQAALIAAEAGKEIEARSIIADAWAWVKENLSLDGLSENASQLSERVSEGASDLGEKISEGASQLSEKISEGWASLFSGDDDDAADSAAQDASGSADQKADTA